MLYGYLVCRVNKENNEKWVMLIRKSLAAGGFLRFRPGRTKSH